MGVPAMKLVFGVCNHDKRAKKDVKRERKFSLKVAGNVNEKRGKKNRLKVNKKVNSYFHP